MRKDGGNEQQAFGKRQQDLRSRPPIWCGMVYIAQPEGYSLMTSFVVIALMFLCLLSAVILWLSGRSTPTVTTVKPKLPPAKPSPWVSGRSTPTATTPRPKLPLASPSSDQKSIERTFNSVFALITADRREALIDYYITKKRVGRVDAMLMAISDRQREENRW
jgi:hypothetical protein